LDLGAAEEWASNVQKMWEELEATFQSEDEALAM